MEFSTSPRWNFQSDSSNATWRMEGSDMGKILPATSAAAQQRGTVYQLSRHEKQLRQMAPFDSVFAPKN
jgi:hypothetical protein